MAKWPRLSFAQRRLLPLSPCGREWLATSEARAAGEGSVSADRDPSSGADCVRATFSHKGRRKEVGVPHLVPNVVAPNSAFWVEGCARQ